MSPFEKHSKLTPTFSNRAKNEQNLETVREIDKL